MSVSPCRPRRTTAWNPFVRLAADFDALHVHVDAVDRHLGVLGQREGHLLDEVAGDRVDVRPVLDDHVEVHVHAGVGGRDHHAAAQAGVRQDLRDAVSHRQVVQQAVLEHVFKALGRRHHRNPRGAGLLGLRFPGQRRRP